MSAASRLRRISARFGWPSLVLFGLLPAHSVTAPEAARMFFFMGFPAIALGVWLRVWTRGYERKEGFVIDGPYRYVRNPVELGTVLAYAGFGAALGIEWWANLSVVVLAVAHMSLGAIAYERELYLKLGTTYLRYVQRVRRWIPNRYPAMNRSDRNFSILRAISNEKDSLLWILGYAGVYAARRHYNF